MNIFQLKIIAMIAMFLDHIAYFFPDLPMSLPLHWIGRIAAPIFIFGVVNADVYIEAIFSKYCDGCYSNEYTN